MERNTSHLGVLTQFRIDKIRKANWLLVYIAYKVMNFHTPENDEINTKIFCFLIAIAFFIFCACDFKQGKGSWIYLTLVIITGYNVFKELNGTACENDTIDIFVDLGGLIVSLLWYETKLFYRIKRRIG